MNRSFRQGLLAAALSLFGLMAHADVIAVSPMRGAAPVPADPTATFATSPEINRMPVVVRELQQQDASTLLDSTEGPAWRVLQVKAPKCGKEKGRTCRELTAKCEAAKKFVKKNGGHAACSTLYEQTTVLLANDKQNPLRILGE